MRNIANMENVSVAQIAIAWLLHQNAVTSVIIGAKRIEQLDDNIAATTIKLNDDDLAALGNASALPSEYPGWMYALQGENRRKQLAESVDA
jgi:aryl-alcohol dehydrogenase-like predicted oxidoreductase